MRMMIKYKFGEILLVKWCDSSHMDGWHNSEAVTRMEMITCKTVGMFHCQTDLLIKLCPTVADNEEVMGPIAIPKGCIIKITRLKETR